MMKKLIAIVLILHFAKISFAATNVPAGNISGATWTMAGSPYLVGGNITIGSLNIQPGVEVIMQGFYQIKVNGILRAVGTQAQPITFKIQDTTGWYNDITTAGGWRGIYFNEFAGTDSSLLSYCIVKDTKHGVNAPMNDNAALFIFYRALKVSHCEFTHCHSIANQSVGSVIVGSIKPNQIFEVEYCNLHHNATRVSAFKFDTYMGGYLKIHDNRFHHNTEGGTVFTLFSEMLFENNEIDSNSNNAIGMGTIRVDGGHNIIRGNKIHHNINQRLAAIACTMGKTTIEKNLICNNQMLDAACGFTDGGGAIHISHNNNGIWDSTEYIIRDNMIANNYANFFGAGIYIHSCKAWIYNNHIVKNKASSNGAGINVFGTTSQLYIQNNIFFGNESTNYGVKPDVYIADATFYTFDYNWIEYPFYENLLVSPGVQRNGDTIHNVINANPQLVNPTAICGHTDNAMGKDFHLQASSTCINKGDLQNLSPSATDYYGLNRISGAKIDIGAHEYLISGGEGINDVADAFPLKIFPNPVSDFLQVEFENAAYYSLYLFDLSGNMLSFQPSHGKSASIDMSKMPAGNYFVSIQNQLGVKVLRKISKF